MTSTDFEHNYVVLDDVVSPDDLRLFALSRPSGLDVSSFSLPDSFNLDAPVGISARGGVLFNSRNLSFHFGSLRSIFQ
jgi:hypothetical protein